MDKIITPLVGRAKSVRAVVSRQALGAATGGRDLATSTGAALGDSGYVLKPVPGETGRYFLAFAKNKMEKLKDLSFIDFTKQNKVQKDEFLLSVESAKTMFDFMSPATLEIIALNKKFAEQPSEDTLKQLKEQPELDDNYLMIVKME
ncbi:glycine cleavage system H, putative [Babesia ovata]|uniref:Glycine cleavage system H, putative n=1 Tax=Babesia ovata TaxID=189622 RepID=A0A2H6K8B5_9APIC|nr:glycine cleavage system H, putative [Babesia ovata]GBE59218.1 glycine cleavage system H, putative [Babesia ovata]